MDLEGLSAHMASHNSPFSSGAIKGILTDMVACIKELLLDGKKVRIDNLAIFAVGIQNKKGCEDKSTYNRGLCRPRIVELRADVLAVRISMNQQMSCTRS